MLLQSYVERDCQFPFTLGRLAENRDSHKPFVITMACMGEVLAGLVLEEKDFPEPAGLRPTDTEPSSISALRKAFKSPWGFK
jgi:hypothetical protein